MVRKRLRVTVQRVECVGCERRGHDPLVVRLVKSLVDSFVVETTVNPVDAEIGKGNEEGELEQDVPATAVPGRAFGEGVVYQGIAADLSDEPRRSENCNDRH